MTLHEVGRVKVLRFDSDEERATVTEVLRTLQPGQNYLAVGAGGLYLPEEELKGAIAQVKRAFP